MPALKHEIEEAELEGVKFHYLVAPVKVITENGKAKGLELIELSSFNSIVPTDKAGYVFAGSELNISSWVFYKKVAAGALSNLAWASPKDVPESFRTVEWIRECGFEVDGCCHGVQNGSAEYITIVASHYYSPVFHRQPTALSKVLVYNIAQKFIVKISNIYLRSNRFCQSI